MKRGGGLPSGGVIGTGPGAPPPGGVSGGGGVVRGSIPGGNIFGGRLASMSAILGGGPSAIGFCLNVFNKSANPAIVLGGVAIFISYTFL